MTGGSVSKPIGVSVETNGNIKDLLKFKRDGHELSTSQIHSLVTAIANGSMEDAQIGAFLMAVLLKGMNKTETGALTEAMKNSGFCFSWPDSWIVGDKHSTGGVGDKVSLALAPALASRGLKVPMISGRGLGFTGGTLDKLESIPGYRVYLSEEEMKTALDTIGCCIVGQTKTIVPADRRMYAVRDVTSTIDSIPLIVSSIISKKASESLHGLVLDVKFGCGSFMQTELEAEELAKALVGAAEEIHLPCTAFLSDMNSPLGKAIGNALEVQEAIQCLRGKGPADFRELVVRLGGELLSNTGISPTNAEGQRLIEESLDDRTALNTFCKMIQYQGVTKEIAERLCGENVDLECLPRSELTTELPSPESGFITNIDALQMAVVCQKLGTSRITTSDSIKYGVGIELLKVIGDEVTKGDPWIRVHHDYPLKEDLIETLLSGLVVTKTKIEKTHSKIIKRISSVVPTIT